MGQRYARFANHRRATAGRKSGAIRGLSTQSCSGDHHGAPPGSARRTPTRWQAGHQAACARRANAMRNHASADHKGSGAPCTHYSRPFAHLRSRQQKGLQMIQCRWNMGVMLRAGHPNKRIATTYPRVLADAKECVDVLPTRIAALLPCVQVSCGSSEPSRTAFQTPGVQELFRLLTKSSPPTRATSADSQAPFRRGRAATRQTCRGTASRARPYPRRRSMS